MNIGKKISLLKDSLNYKNYQEFGKFLDLPGDWILELSKRSEITTVDITRLMRISHKCNVSLEWLLSDNEDSFDFEVKQSLSEGDIGLLLNNIQDKLKENEVSFYGTPMNTDSIKLASDSIDVIKKLIKQNI